jgi:hypothetical protein
MYHAKKRVLKERVTVSSGMNHDSGKAIQMIVNLG